jgi:hypothetical protein
VFQDFKREREREKRNTRKSQPVPTKDPTIKVEIYIVQVEVIMEFPKT